MKLGQEISPAQKWGSFKEKGFMIYEYKKAGSPSKQSNRLFFFCDGDKGKHSLEEIRRDILALEKETEGIIKEALD